MDIFLNHLIQFYSSNATNLRHLTLHNTPCCHGTWRSYCGHRLLLRHFTLCSTTSTLTRCDIVNSKHSMDWVIRPPLRDHIKAVSLWHGNQIPLPWTLCLPQDCLHGYVSDRIRSANRFFSFRYLFVLVQCSTLRCVAVAVRLQATTEYVTLQSFLRCLITNLRNRPTVAFEFVVKPCMVPC